MAGGYIKDTFDFFYCTYVFSLHRNSHHKMFDKYLRCLTLKKSSLLASLFHNRTHVLVFSNLENSKINRNGKGDFYLY